MTATAPLFDAAMTTPTMAEQLVLTRVWAAIQPLLPPKRPHPKDGRPWVEDRAAEPVNLGETRQLGFAEVPPLGRGVSYATEP